MGTVLLALACGYVYCRRTQGAEILMHDDICAPRLPEPHICHVDVFVQVHHILALWMHLDQDLVLPHDLQCRALQSLCVEIMLGGALPGSNQNL